MVRALECVICGASIYSYGHFSGTSARDKRWLSEFRIIYTFRREPCVSGLGIFDPDYGRYLWRAPRDWFREYDDPVPYKIMPRSVTFMYQPGHKDRHGFIMHDACSQITRLAYWPQMARHIRVLEVLNSFPFPAHGETMYWGHTYGGILYHNEDDRYPWENDYASRIDEGDVFKDAHEDPIRIPNLNDIFDAYIEYKAKGNQLTTKRYENCFSKLPWEIRESIAIELCTSDALKLRLVTAAYYPILTSQSFWRSRFQPDGECGFVVEKWDARDDTNWVSLYRVFKQYDSPGWRNRRRIWQIAKSIVRLTNLELRNKDQSYESYRKVLHDEQNLHFNKHYRVTGDIFDGVETEQQTNFRSGCQLFTTYTTRMPSGLTEIIFLVYSYFNTTYVVGIRYKDRDGSNIDVGYRPTAHDGMAKEMSVNFRALNGFILAMGSSGLHAIKIITEKGISNWIGNPDNSPITRRLANLGTILGIRTGFDAYKLVSFEVSVSDDVIDLPDSPLCDRAMWYPTIPDPELCLNETSYVAEDLYSFYRPIFWLHFGGPGGSLLQYISSIVVDTIDLGVCAIQFRYSSGKRYVNSPWLGRHLTCFGRERHYFEIDGAGGERINMVKYSLCTDEYEEPDAPYYGYLSHLSIRTNKNRGISFINAVNNTTEHSISIAPGTVPTGFYASQVVAFGLSGFGVISEKVPDEIASDAVEFDERESETKIHEIGIGKCKPELAKFTRFDEEEISTEVSECEKSVSEG